ncbi:hypothetical protein THASP1DRAFT_31731, partial [Thamnocephalis sphaerospora]
MTALEIFIIVFLAVYLPVQLATLWVAWKLRRLPAIRHRSLSFTILIVLMDTAIVLHEFLPLLMLDTYPCSVSLWIVGMLMPTASVLWIARFYRLAALYRWNEQELLRYGQPSRSSAATISSDALLPEYCESTTSPTNSRYHLGEPERHENPADRALDNIHTIRSSRHVHRSPSDATHCTDDDDAVAITVSCDHLVDIRHSNDQPQNGMRPAHVGNIYMARKRAHSTRASVSKSKKRIGPVDFILDHYTDRGVLWTMAVVGVVMLIICAVVKLKHQIFDERPYFGCGINIIDTIPVLISLFLILVVGGGMIATRVARARDNYGIRTELIAAVVASTVTLLTSMTLILVASRRNPTSKLAFSTPLGFTVATMLHGFAITLSQ